MRDCHPGDHRLGSPTPLSGRSAQRRCFAGARYSNRSPTNEPKHFSASQRVQALIVGPDNIMAFQSSPPLEPVCHQPLWRFSVDCTFLACGTLRYNGAPYTPCAQPRITMALYALLVYTLFAEAMQKRTGHQHVWRSLRQVFLVFGRSGWIGGLVGEILTQQGAKFEFANARLEDRAGILADIERVRC